MNRRAFLQTAALPLAKPPAPEPVRSGDSNLETVLAEIRRVSLSMDTISCDRVTRTEFGDHRQDDWLPWRILEASLSYRDGVERYRDFRMNGEKCSARDVVSTFGLWTEGDHFGLLCRASTLPPERFQLRGLDTQKNLRGYVFELSPQDCPLVVARDRIARSFPCRAALLLDEQQPRLRGVQYHVDFRGKWSGYDYFTGQTEFGAASLGETPAWLPVRAECYLIVQTLTGKSTHATTEWGNYRVSKAS